MTGGLIQAETQRRETSDCRIQSVATEAKFGNVAPLSPSNNAPSSSYLCLRFEQRNRFSCTSNKIFRAAKAGIKDRFNSSIPPCPRFVMFNESLQNNLESSTPGSG